MSVVATPVSCHRSGTLHQNLEHKIYGLFHFHFQRSWDMCLMASIHPKPHREGNSGRVKKTELPHPQDFLFPHFVHGMISSHAPD